MYIACLCFLYNTRVRLHIYAKSVLAIAVSLMLRCRHVGLFCWCTEGARPHVCSSSISTEMIHSYTKQSIDVLSMMNA